MRGCNALLFCSNEYPKSFRFRILARIPKELGIVFSIIEQRLAAWKRHRFSSFPRKTEHTHRIRNCMEHGIYFSSEETNFHSWVLELTTSLQIAFWVILTPRLSTRIKSFMCFFLFVAPQRTFYHMTFPLTIIINEWNFLKIVERSDQSWVKLLNILTLSSVFFIKRNILTVIKPIAA